MAEGLSEVRQDHPRTDAQGHAVGSLWTYLHRSGSVPTNNAAERSMRKADLWRKMSLGADSEGGCRFVERMLTVAGTARKRSIDLLDWHTRALQARVEGIPAPAFRA